MFQAYMNHTFQQEINEGWLVIYMDNILIFSKTLDEHRARTRQILETIHREQSFLKPEKCTFDAQGSRGRIPWHDYQTRLHHYGPR